MCGLIAEITRRNQPSAPQLPLIGGVPLSNVSGFGIYRHVDVNTGAREECFSILRERISTREPLPGVGESAGRIWNIQIRADRRVGGFALIPPRFGDIVENRTADAQRVAAVAMRVPDHSDARREIRFLAVP